MYYYAPQQEQKAFFRKEIHQHISRLILHQFASEVIEYMSAQTENEKERRNMVQSFYG